MAKEYLLVDGKLVKADAKLIQVPDTENLNDLADENGAYATQSEEVANEIEELIVNGVIDGSPKGVYADLSALQTAFPSGASGVYLTRDNGHWYYWNGSAWTDGGVYQTDLSYDEVKDELFFIEGNNNNLNLSWEQGGFDFRNGSLLPSLIRLRSKEIFLPLGCKLNICANGQKYNGCVYSQNGSFKNKMFEVYQTIDKSILYNENVIVRLTIGKTNDSNITPSEALITCNKETYTSTEINGIKDSRNKLYTCEIIPITGTGGYIDLSTSVVSLNPIPLDNYNYSIVECNSGEWFTINGVVGGTPILFAFLDENYNILSKSNSQITCYDYEVQAPTNSKYLVINDKGNLTSYKGKVRNVEYVINSYINNVSGVSNWEQGNIDINTGVDAEAIHRVRSGILLLKKTKKLHVIPNGLYYNVFVYDKYENFESAFTSWKTDEDYYSYEEDKCIRISCRKPNNNGIYPQEVTLNSYVEDKELNISSGTNDSIEVFISNTGNCSIRASKEQVYSDGTQSKVELYLLEDVNNNFYISKDLKTKNKIFSFGANSYKYSFGITPKGDIIAVQDADTLGSYTKDESQRTNPYVWLANENWSVKHVVDFGSSLKPCGWLMNCGFQNMPDGSFVFCEYTRRTVATSNTWKVSGDITNPNNWVVTKTFEVTTTDDQGGFKHSHAIQYDHISNVSYLMTGDTDDGANVLYSLDYGATWNSLLSNSEKYCRVLNYVFASDYIYWASDTALLGKHYVFRAERLSNGVMNVNSIEDWIELTGNSATYTLSYLQELNVLVILDRCDGNALNVPVRIVNLEDGTLHTIATLETASGNSETIGFRTTYADVYALNSINVGFGFKSTNSTTNVNLIKGFGNTGTSGNPSANINNLVLKVAKISNGYKLLLDTHYI